MQQMIIGDIKVEAPEPVEIVQVKLFPILMVLLLVVSFFLFVYAIPNAKNRVSNEAQVQMGIATAVERIYAEAQIDALEGRIRVAPSINGSYTWIDSPWSDGRSPRFTDIADYKGE